MTPEIEQHPLAPFLPQNAKLLMLGSFPPPKQRWKMDFYYPNFQNDMWRILGLIFFQNKDYFIDHAAKNFNLSLIQAFLNEQGIAIYDTAEQIVRLKGNASDQFLQIEKATDIPHLLQHIPLCRHIMTTGDKATDTLMTVLTEDTVKPTLQHSSRTWINGQEIFLHRMPSSSRAYPLALDKKAEQYAAFFRSIGML
ncbi:uracil-DNA glycosylase family protein [Acinetobacter puyangensis]|uniref:G/U mismatch-specific uracil-DNA glycosylase n=1 Tax=Acinetobacter puyangensis TaxID=1096779 RepID=A0A240E6W8_9GAMM|nr:uracil-DNA glycosylase family protein [Acinetobacter puyangensis]SNX43983.1 G/U mismatch-specific uracil-DNA glycosylase [Acinetobacter puyangensis]